MRHRFKPYLCLLACLLVTTTVQQTAFGDIRIEGLKDLSEIEDYIQIIAEQREDDVKTEQQLADSVIKGMKAKGYYDAEVEIADNTENGDIVFEITAGDIYRIGEIILEDVPEGLSIGINEGDILDADAVLTAQRTLFQTINDENCYYNLDIQHTVLLSPEDKTAQLTFIVHGQDGAKFGETVFEGAEDIDRDYLANFLEYEAGECWKPIKLEDTKAALYASGLLASAQTTLPENLPDDGAVPIVFDVKQRAFRSVKLGAGYNTNDGAGVSAEWEHRNILGAGEKLSVRMRLYELVQNLGASFAKPMFFRDDQSLLVETGLNREDTDAYNELSYNAGASVLRQITDKTSVSLGVGYELSRIEDEDGSRNFGLFSTPATIDYDGRDDLFDPHSGWKLNLRSTPFFDTLGEADPFIRTRFTASTYFDLSDAAIDPVLALRASYGAIYGGSLTNVPASKRFYAGGGGSIRGFGYQDVGPKDDDGDPSGGLSVFEMTAETRFKLTQSFGAVAFVDAGQVYEETTPDLGADLAVGAGIGARYYTDFGPLRFDVAVPLNRRDEADSNFQIYLSIGQAF